MKIIEAIVKKIYRIDKTILSVGTKDLRRPKSSHPGGRCDKLVFGCFRVTGFAGNDAFIVIFPVFDQSIAVFQISGRVCHVCGRDGICRRSGNTAEVFILDGCCQDQSQIVGSGVMVGVRQPVGIYKVCVLTPKFLARSFIMDTKFSTDPAT